MKILFVWTGVTSYMADCWRELSSIPGVSFSAVVENVESGKEFVADKIFKGLDVTVVEKDSVVDNLPKPDVLFAVGWHSCIVRNLVTRKDWKDVYKVCCFDMPWRTSLRCFAARFVLRRFLRNYDAAYVPGASAQKYAKWLGFKNVATGLFSIDTRRFAASQNSSSRSGFLYLGRFSPEKRVDVIKKAYERYRAQGGNWDISYYGQGGEFISPEEIPSLYASKAYLLLASSFDPWPLVAVEATAAGCGVIMSDRCGNRHELSSAITVPYNNVDALARAMLKAEKNPLPQPCDLSKYDCREWAQRTSLLASSHRKKILHICAGWEATNGAATLARAIASDQLSRGESVSYAVWASPSKIREADEVWIHCAWKPCLWWAALFAKSFVRVPSGSFDPLRLKFGKWKKSLVSCIEKFFLRKASSVVATCKAEGEWIEEYEKRASVRVLDTKSLDWGECAPRSISKDGRGSEFRILYMGRRHPLKGICFLEEAVRRLNGERAGKIVLEIVSDALGEKKEEAFERCDVLVLPTLSDNFGIVVAEALKRGKKVITTDGAPAWADDPARGKALIYIEGFRNGSDEFRIASLIDAIKKIA